VGRGVRRGEENAARGGTRREGLAPDAEVADARHEVAAQAAALAAESLRLVEAEYQEGTATITRLLDAELALTQAARA